MIKTYKLNIVGRVLVVLYCLIGINSCKNEKNYTLDLFFAEVEKQIGSDSVLLNFKSSYIDTAVVNYNMYPEIFTDAFASVLEDSLIQVTLEEFCYNNEINLNSRIGVYVIIASFHKRYI